MRFNHSQCRPAAIRAILALVDISARTEGPDVQHDLGFRGDVLFPIERIALEFLRCVVLIVDDDADLFAGGDLQFGGNELMILDDD